MTASKGQGHNTLSKTSPGIRRQQSVIHQQHLVDQNIWDDAQTKDSARDLRQLIMMIREGMRSKASAYSEIHLTENDGNERDWAPETSHLRFLFLLKSKSPSLQATMQLEIYVMYDQDENRSKGYPQTP